MKNSKKLLSLLLAFVMVFLVACGGNTSQTDDTNGEDTKVGENTETTGDTETTDTGADNQGDSDGPKTNKNEVVVAGTNSLSNMNYLTTNKAADHQWNANFVETLLEYNSVGKLVGSLAESWEVNDDQTVWTFKLRPGVKWVTNTQEEYGELTAEDFVTGLRHVAEFKSGTSWLVSGIVKRFAEYMGSDFSDSEWEKVGVKALDEHTVEYTLEQPTPFFGDIATYSTLMPVNASFLESKGDGCLIGSPEPTTCQFGSLAPDSILYNGAYILQSVDEKSSIVMVKNNAFYDAANVEVEKYTEIYDDGSDPYSIKTGFENGTYPSMSLRPTWSDYEEIKEQYKDSIHTSLPNAVTFGVIFNFNRQAFNETNYAQDESLRENTKKAIRNENFRKALRAAFDRQARLEVAAPEQLAKDTLRNINNYKEVGSTSDGKNYYQLVNEIYNNNTDTTVDLSDGQDPFLNKEAALKYIEAAKEEGIEFPVHLDLLVIDTSDNLVKQANSMKQSVAVNTDDQIIIEPVLRSQDDVYAVTYRNEDPAGSDYDISTFTGWGPDYNDPQTYVQTFSPTEGSYMVGTGLGTVVDEQVENKELKEELGFMEYERLYQEAKAITNDNDKRMEAFAKADSLLIEKALFIPVAMQTRFEIVSKYVPFSMPYSQVGLSGNKRKYLKVSDNIVSTEEYNSAKEEWQKQVDNITKEQ